jgi:hypothetical protein
MTPLSMLSWTLLAMALALLLGVTIRRVLPSMIAFAATFGGCLVLAQTWLPEFLFRVGEIPVRVNAAPPHRMDRLTAAQPPDLARARRNGLLVAVAAFLVLASVRWLRQHPAE